MLAFSQQGSETWIPPATRVLLPFPDPWILSSKYLLGFFTLPAVSRYEACGPQPCFQTLLGTLGAMYPISAVNIVYERGICGWNFRTALVCLCEKGEGVWFPLWKREGSRE